MKIYNYENLTLLLLVRSQLVSVDSSLIYTFRSHYGPGVDSTSNRNEYREYFLGVNEAGA